MLRAQPWKGNVRELENFAMNLLLFDREGTRVTGEQVARSLGTAAAEAAAAAAGPEAGSLSDRMVAHERALVEAALRRAGGNKAAAARELGVAIRTFYKVLDRLGLSS
jgi:DNA-binding NtrC family response regulator